MKNIYNQRELSGVRKTLNLFLAMIFVCLFLVHNRATAQMTFTSGAGLTQGQNFDAIGAAAAAALPSGFQMSGPTTPFAMGTSTGLAAGTSGAGILTSSSGGGPYNFANGVTASSTDRSIGFLNTGTYTSPKFITLTILNSTGSTITSLSLSWNYEKSRSGSRAWTWTFAGASGTTTGGGLAYVADAGNTVVSNPPLSTATTATISGLSILTGGSYSMTWTLTGTGGSSNGQALSIDDLILTATTAATPNISVSAGSLPSFGSIATGSTSLPQSYTVSGTNLTNDITIEAPANYEVSLSSGSGYVSTLTLTQSGGTVGSTPIFAHFTPASVGPLNGAITHKSTDAVQKDVNVSGTGTCATVSISAGGPTTFCSPGSVSLSTGASGTYQWLLNGNTIGGATSSSFSATASGAYSVAVDNGSCVATSSPTTVTVNSFGHTGTIYSENMGNTNASGNPSVTSYNTSGLFQNSPYLSFSNTITSGQQSDLRSTLQSTGAYTGASGGNNVFLGTSGAIAYRDLIISGMNTLNYGTSLVLTFGAKRDNATPVTDVLTVEASVDGSTYTPLIAVTPANTSWALYTVSSGIPATGNLRIRFSKNSGTAQFRVDDVKLTGTTSALDIAAMGPVSFCNGSSVVLSSNIPTGNSWSSGPSTMAIVVNSSGTYSVTTTTNGCSQTSSGITVTVNPNPTITASVTTNVGCGSGSIGVLDAINFVGAGSPAYSWNSSPVQTTATATGLPVGTYTVTVTDGNGCKGTSSATLTSTPASIMASGISASTTEYCLNSCSAPAPPIALGVLGGSLGFGAGWVWYSGSCGGTLEGTGPTLSVSPSVPTTYYLRAENGGCFTDCISVPITIK